MNLLKTVYDELYHESTKSQRHNLEELSSRMAKLVDRSEPWSYASMRGVINGHKGFALTPEMETALNMIMAQLDNAHPLQARLVQITAYSINGYVEPGSIITGKSERCVCGVLFVRHHNFQRYCCRECPGRKTSKVSKNL